MTIDCGAEETLMSSDGTKDRVAAHDCNPQDDHSLHGPQTVSREDVPERPLTPHPEAEEEDLPPWSALEQLKKEANEVALYSFPDDEQRVIITVTSSCAEDAPSVAPSTLEVDCPSERPALDENRKSDSHQRNTADFNPWETNGSSDEKNAQASFETPTKAVALQQSPTSLSEYTSFAKGSSGYVFPVKVGTPSKSSTTVATSGVTSSSKHNGSEGQELTVENFNQFLELSSMTTNSHDHAIAMGTREPSAQDHEALENSMLEDETPSRADGESAGAWPERLLRKPEMTDAPSGILFVFDRMLDCIDPGVARHDGTKDKDYVCGYETDQSSAMSLSLRSSWLLKEFGDISIAGSNSTGNDDSSLFGSGLLPSGGERPRKAPLGAEWLDESLDCIFPCWKDSSTGGEEKPPKQPLSVHELTAALEASRKRKWAGVDRPEDDGVEDLALVEEGILVHRPNGNVQTIAKSFSSHDSIDDPFDFPTPEFPPPVWKKDPPEVADTASGSTLSELFEGLVFGTPSDEKDEGNEDDELRRFLDRTSVTEETSTLSYSSGTV